MTWEVQEHDGYEEYRTWYFDTLKLAAMHIVEMQEEEDYYQYDVRPILIADHLPNPKRSMAFIVNKICEGVNYPEVFRTEEAAKACADEWTSKPTSWYEHIFITKEEW